MELKKGKVLNSTLGALVLYHVIFYASVILMRNIVGLAKEKYMICHTVGAIITILFMMVAYGKNIVFIEKKEDGKRKIKQLLFLSFSIIVMAIGLNDLIMSTVLVKQSDGFQNTNASFYAGAFAIQMVGNAIFTPIAEEILYRGIVLKNLSSVIDTKKAIVFTALIFGVLHGNIVQFIFATILGIAFGIAATYAKGIYLPIILHMIINSISLIRTNFGIANFQNISSTIHIMVATVLLVVGVLGILISLKIKK